ncbi:hypothetical protein BDY21DRAFT_166870 [Lineolata rhizophorae]|uniref:Uncharacterized protein n=1 Tax=Lineolata rhizophorae TaxID=578093 RepID=A0A6A6PAS6_9PEZI|nr:hypothetical protein BDY21DRAFT_166870 [Lineolata rhizophorae]
MTGDRPTPNGRTQRAMMFCFSAGAGFLVEGGARGEGLGEQSRCAPGRVRMASVAPQLGGFGRRRFVRRGKKVPIERCGEQNDRRKYGVGDAQLVSWTERRRELSEQPENRAIANGKSARRARETTARPPLVALLQLGMDGHDSRKRSRK